MVKVGLAGIGFMGWIHWLGYERSDGAEVAAICTRDAKKLSGDWTGIQGNFGPQGEMVDLEGIQKYSEFDELLRDPSIDVIDICLPPNLHVDFSIRAFEAGKHVFCEKPLALTADDCDRMVSAAQAANKQLVVGHVLPYMSEFKYLRESVEQNRYGKLLGGWFKRVISDPLWLTDFYNPQVAGGPLIDLHVHDTHYIRMLFGMPTRVISQGRERGEVVEYCNTLFEFNDRDLVVGAASGVINQQGRSFTHGFEVQFERATLQFELAVLAQGIESMPLKVLTSDGEVIYPELPGGDDVTGFVGEIEEMVATVVSGKASSILSGELARDAIAICQAQSESVKQRKPIDC